MKDTKVTVNLSKASEAHPVAMLVQIASRYESRVYMAQGDRRVNAKSIMGMMALGVDNGIELNISADGADEMDAVKAISDYLTGVA